MSTTTRISPQAFEKYKSVSTATLTTQLLKRGFHNMFLLQVFPIQPEQRMVGYAFTLRYVPAREDMVDQNYDNTTNVQRLAVEAIGPEEVLVIDARGDTRAGTIGDILATRIKMRGAAGLVTDGSVRDAPAFRKLDFPTYSRSAAATTSFAIHHPVDMQLPVACGGVMIRPGDLLVGDGEGVVVIPISIAEEIAHDAYDQERKEEFIHTKIQGGASILGVYPPDATTLAEYEVWRKQNG